MSKSKDAAEAFFSNWQKLKEARPTENNFTAFGYPNLSYEALDEVFRKWKAVIDALEARGTWVTSPEAAIADHPLSAAFNDMNALAINALNNGTSWLVATNFLPRVADAQNIISLLAAKRISINREIARELVARGHDELERVVAAATAAKVILAYSETVQNNALSAHDASKAATKSLEDIQASKADASKAAADVAAAVAAVEESRAKVDSAYKNIEESRQSADDRMDALDARARLLGGTIDETQSAAEGALRSVQDALRAVRSQGLAHSFQSRSDALRRERRLWTLLFIAAILMLTALSATFALELDQLNYESLIVLLLRKIALAGPAVWLGWYSAKQVARVARVQEDYEYKAASALAFQSYKDEVLLGGDAALSQNLLQNAIDTFGENPVRLYEHAHAEVVTPLESVLKNLPPDTISALLAAAKGRP